MWNCIPIRLISLCLALILGASVLAQQPSLSYLDHSQLDVPWPKHSFVKVPWRAFLETKSGDDFLYGIGVNYNIPGKSEQTGCTIPSRIEAPGSNSRGRTIASRLI